MGFLDKLLGRGKEMAGQADKMMDRGRDRAEEMMHRHSHGEDDHEHTHDEPAGTGGAGLASTPAADPNLTSGTPPTSGEGSGTSTTPGP
jgi:hypothetical protein